MAEAGIGNISFVQGDITALPELFADRPAPDAITGRMILVWVPERIAVLRACAEVVRPGGLVVFDEPDCVWDPAVPCPPLWGQAAQWFVEVVGRIGVELRMGPVLHSAFRTAGQWC